MFLKRIYELHFKWFNIVSYDDYRSKVPIFIEQQGRSERTMRMTSQDLLAMTHKLLVCASAIVAIGSLFFLLVFIPLASFYLSTR